MLTILLTVIGVLAILLFAQQVNGTISLLRASATEFAVNSAERGDSFEDAAVDFEIRERRDGIHMFATVPNAFGPADTSALIIVDGVEREGSGVRERFAGSRFGFAVATLFGVRVTPAQPFLEGVIGFTPDADLFQNIAITLLATIVLAALVVGLFAAAVGRYIAQQAIRPLVDVTEALQRFAARDFRSEQIAIAGRGDFNVLAHAYNAAAAQVAAAFAERDAAETQMRQFVADAGHELRTPLTIVLGYIDLLRRRVDAGDERSRFIFSSIGAEGKRMRTLVDNLVLLAKLEGEDTRPPEPFSVAALIAEVIDVRRVLHPAVRFDVDVAADGAAIADRSEIHEALANIVDNAIKYAPGSPIAVSTTKSDARTLEISIADEGPGIDPADRTSIFERFYRGSLRGDVDGSGLGLAIARRAVERAGGTLRLDESRASGTCFAITLRVS